jgi:hypothetical protein
MKNETDTRLKTVIQHTLDFLKQVDIKTHLWQTIND